MTNEIWLSILVPVYNVEHYLGPCINSIARQTAGDRGIEIIMAEDASTDGSRAVAERLRDQYPHQVKLVYQSQNQGLSAARNRLLDEARGEHVWFIDSDDYMLDGAIDELRAIMKQHDPDLILCDYRKNRLGSKKSFFGPTKRLSGDVTKLVKGVFKSQKMYSWLKISRRSLWSDGLRFPVGKAFEDIATTPWLLLRATNYYYTPKPWLHYRQRPGSIMESIRRQPDVFDEAKHRDMAQALVGFKDLLLDHLPERCPSTDYHLSDFCAKEFTKTGSRMARAERSRTDIALIPGPLDSFLATWQSCSPLAFEKLAIEYVKRFRFIRFANLIYFLNLAKAS